MGTSIVTFYEAVDAAEQLWQSSADAQRRYAAVRSQARAAANAGNLTSLAIHDRAAADALTLRKALVRSAHTQIVTAWEVFLFDLVQEYLVADPTHFVSRWRFRATKKTPYGELVSTIERRPFQNLDSAKKVLKRYLGACVLGNNAQTGVDFDPVEEALALRHSIVHRGGKATALMRSLLSIKRQSAEGYLLSRPATASTIPATHFERLKAGVVAAATTLDTRTWTPIPRPP